MERSSSQRDLRAERLSKTPYSRPEPSRLKKSTSMAPLATLRSIVSYVSSPFSRSTSLLPQHANDLDVNVDAEAMDDRKSESGSEDGWNGEPPTHMTGQDIFSLAAAGGREGAEFDRRAATWRAKGELPGGKRELARLGLDTQPTLTDLGPPTPTAPGHFSLLKSSPSMPALSSSLQVPEARGPGSSIRRARSPLSSQQNTILPSRTPLPSFIPSASSSTSVQPATPGLSSSASSVALTAFLEAKKGQQMTSEDFRVIETLTDNMKAESHVGSPPRLEKTGSWAAGSYTSGARPSQTYAFLSTPAKQSHGDHVSPGPAFSVGSGPTPNSFVQPSPYKQRYLGPGMSPRRMMPQSKKSSLKPLFNFGAVEDEVAKNKKRRTDEEEAMDVDQRDSKSQNGVAIPAKGLSSSVSMPSFSTMWNSSPAGKPKSYLAASQRIPARPSPLGQSINSPGSVTSTPGDDAKARRKAEAEAAGKKRAAEIIMDIIDEEIGPIVPTRKAEPIVFNPYDRTTLNPSSSAQIIPAIPSTTPSTSYAGSTPRKSALKNQGSPARRTPTRGAAAKLEAHREAMKGSKPLSTIDRIKGVRPWDKGGSPVKSAGRVGTPTPDDDIIEIDELFDESEAASSRAPSPAPKPARQPSHEPSGPTFTSASSKIPAAETFKPFDTPTISFSPQPLPKAAPLPSIGSFDSPTRNSIIAASKTDSKVVDKPTFAFTPAPPLEQEKAESRPSLQSTPSTKVDLTSIYLSAKDSALKIAKPALPFFTFTLPPRSLEPAKTKEQAEAAEAVKREASSRTAPTFTFTLTASTPVAPAIASEWTCNTCMLKNPASATEKCTICEEPKPSPAPAKPPSFAFGSSAIAKSAAAGGEWTCDTCMLKNPGSATEKCTICEAPKPSVAPGKPPSFGFGMPAKNASAAGGDWTCSMCMLKNPDSAKEKCGVCEEPRPKASNPVSDAPKFSFASPPIPKTSIGEGGEWTCSLCMLKNPASATVKCQVCENPR